MNSMVNMARPQPTVHPRAFIACVFGLGAVAMLLAALAESEGDAQRSVVYGAGVASVIFGVGAFLWHGGPRVTVMGLFNIASAMFVGAAGAYAAAVNDERVPVVYLGYAVLAGLALQVVVSTVAGRAVPLPERLPTLSPANAAWAVRWGVAALLLLALIERLGLTAALPDLVLPFIEGTAVSATVVLTVGVLWRPDARLLSFGTILVAVSFVIYATVFHSGAGRLRIVTLAGALLILYSIRFRRRLLKQLVPIAIPIALFLLAQQRLSLQESISAGGSAGRNGLESMLVPIVIFGQLLKAQADGFPLAWGTSFLTFPLGLLPESWVPNAPGALGYELALIYSPELYGTGYSAAATLGAEGFWNWALPGLFVIALLAGMLLRFLDGRIVRAAARLHDGRRAVVALSFWAVFGGAVADLAWNGQHIFFTRTLSRLPFLGLLWGLAGLHESQASLLRRRHRPREADPRPKPHPRVTTGA
mgnify:CR=1 FL=1